MTGGAMITMLIQDGLDLKSDDTYITAEWRPRALFAIQKAVNEVYKAAAWDFKQGNTTLSLTSASDRVDLPADFYKTGPGGGLFILNQQPVRFETPNQFWKKAYVAASAGTTGTYPNIYTIHGYNAATQRRQAVFFPKPASGSVTVQLLYEKGRPAIVDTVTAGASNLEAIPDFFHEDVIYVGALDWLLHGVSDGRAIAEISPRFDKAIKKAVSDYHAGDEELEQYGDRGIPDLGMW